MKDIEAKKLVAVLIAAYPSNKATHATVQLYAEMMGDLDYKVTHQAIKSIIATSKFFPSVAEIRTAASPAVEKRLSMEGWGDVGMAVRRFGRNTVPVFDDPITEESVRQMGWLYLCNSTNEIADRARFCELYTGLQERGIRVEQRNLLDSSGATALLFSGKDIPDGKS